MDIEEKKASGHIAVPAMGGVVVVSQRVVRHKWGELILKLALV